MAAIQQNRVASDKARLSGRRNADAHCTSIYVLYALVDPERAGGHALAELARLVAHGGATLVQLRDKHGATRAMVETARAVMAALAALGCRS